jgi:outer membrane protein OmpA-like peptidoglycan-associated protein/predicted MFS family arabinose efflux permease
LHCFYRTNFRGRVLQSDRNNRTFAAGVLTIFMPLVAGYFLSYAFRTVNGPLTGLLSNEFSLDAAQLGFLTSCYFITATIAQIPIGWALDAYGPGRVQGTMMLVAALGAALFAFAGTFFDLAVARALIGLGVAGALMAGMKANVMSFDNQRVALMNGMFVAVGAVGALATSLPLDWLLRQISWRDLFVGLSAASALSAALILWLVPSLPAPAHAKGVSPIGLLQVVTDARFWRLAPLSALICGSAWAIQGLWAAAWLRDVAHMDASELANALFIMAAALCGGAFAFGVILDRLRRRGIGPDIVFVGLAIAVIAAEIALALHWPVPVFMILVCIGASGAATVVSYSITPQLFPSISVGRANSALNVLHFGVAAVVQNLVGLVVSHWVTDAYGHYPEDAYGVAFLAVAALQATALLWFVWNTGAAKAPAPGPLVRVAKAFDQSRLAFNGRGLTGLTFTGVIVGVSVLPFSAAIDGRRPGNSAIASFTSMGNSIDEAHQVVTIAQLQTRLARTEVVLAQLGAQLADLRLQFDSMRASQIPLVSGSAPIEPSARNAACHAVLTEFRSPIILGYASSKVTLTRSQQRLLAPLLQAVVGCPQIAVEIRGYGDRRGPAELNVALARRRADVTADYLKAQGLAPDHLRVEADGASPFVASNADAQGRSRSRRVEVRVRL